jgi:hypothetical protein
MNIRTFATAVLLCAPVIAAAQTVPPAPAATPAPATEPVGTVALVTGSVTVATGAQPRSLSAGDPIFAGQTITVAHNSYANLKFADGGRVLLRPNSEFAVESFRYKPAAAPIAPAAGAPAAPASAEGTAFFRLVRGGFRAISGLIGKVDRQSYKVTTPVATIGIRGTDYEVQLCTDDCPTQAKADASGTLVASSDLSGLQLAQAGTSATAVILATHEGSIEARTSTGATFRVDAGQVGVMLANGQTFMLPAVPDAMLRDPAADPEACE